MRMPQPLKRGRREQRARDPLRMLGGGDAGEQHLAGVRGDHPARLLRAVQCQRVCRQLLAPEARFESSAKSLRLGAERGGTLGKAQRLGEHRGMPLGAVHVALDLAEGDRPFGQPAVVMKDRVEGVLPTLIGQPVLRLAVIFDEAVAVAVAVAIDPRSAASAFGHSERTVDRSPVRRKYSPSRSTKSGVASMLP